ncbi:hypothetical protein Btru_075188 [Bulinus truncatus]|nr:hypothetical protein Btru_075188 [Bulinus truncatus]
MDEKTELANGSGCIFPKDLRGPWTRSRDQVVVTFTDSQLTGLNIRWNSQRMNNFDCHSSTYNTYIINSSFTSLLGVQNYYLCWSLVKVTSAAYILYELSETINSTNFDSNTTGYVQSPETPLDTNKVCTSPNFFTTLIKDGATSSDVAVHCPTQLNATFTYAMCPTTELSFCSDGKTGKADYSMCSTQVFHSGGCIRYVFNTGVSFRQGVSGDLGGGAFLEFASNKLPDKADRSFSGVYYSGDCTTVVSSGVSTSITLTQKNLCLSSTTTAATTTAQETTTTTGRQSLPTNETLSDDNEPSSSPETLVGKSKGNDSVTVGVAVGITVGLFTLFLLALLLFLLVWRQKLMIKVADLFSNRKQLKNEAENKDETKAEIFKIKVTENFRDKRLVSSSSTNGLDADDSPENSNEGTSINTNDNGVEDTHNYRPNPHKCRRHQP